MIEGVTQWHIEIVLSEKQIKMNHDEWLHELRKYVPPFLADLKSRGLTVCGHPPTDGLSGIQDVVTLMDCRVIRFWIPYWSRNLLAGKFVARLDTFTKEPREVTA